MDIPTLDELIMGTFDKPLTMSNVKAALKTARALPMTHLTIHKGEHIFRARSHAPDKRLHFSRDCSYRTDLDNIPMQRANDRGNSVFYGSISSAELREALLTVCMETSKLMWDGRQGHQTFTVGVWEAKKTFTLPILHSPEDEGYDPIRTQAKEGLKQMLEQFDEGLKGNMGKLLLLLDREFSKRVRSTDPETAYLISAAFAELLYEGGQRGLAYPSVATEGRGQNIALLPNVVEKYLKNAGAQLVQFQRGATDEDVMVCQYEMAVGHHFPWRWINLHPRYALGQSYRMDDGTL